MLGTRVRATVGGGHGVGGRIEATTGIGPLGLVDEMEVTGWDPPHGAYVKHLGRFVRGTAAFEVRPRPGGSTFVWTEDLDLPLGAAGRVGFRLVRPLIAYGLRLSLRRFARLGPHGDVGPACRLASGCVEDIIVGADGRPRCGWAGATETTSPTTTTSGACRSTGRRRLFEKLSLEAFQSGLSWLTILRKRPAFRGRVRRLRPGARWPRFDDADVRRLLADTGIVRNRAKVEAAIANARAALELPDGLRSAALVVRARPGDPAAAGVVRRRAADLAGVHRDGEGRCAGAGSGSSARPRPTR